MAEIQMPKGHRPIFAKLLTLSAPQREGLLQSLGGTPAAFSLTRLAESIAEPAKLDLDEAHELVGMLSGMFGAMVRGGETPENFASLAIDAARDQLEGIVDLNSINWDEGRQLVAELMKFDHALGVSAKIIGVVSDHDHVYCRARILTDIRPVFASSVTEPPAAMVVVHTLRLSYHSFSNAGEIQGFYLALDSSDLEELQQQIERAIEKEKTLKSVLSSKQLPVLNSSELR
jgi:hypothetical protein